MVRASNWPRAVVCDLDGTVIDSIADMSAALNRALHQNGFDPVPVERLRTMVGAGAGKLIARALADLGVEGIDDAKSQAVFASFIQAYTDQAAKLTTIYDGAEETLAGWHAQGLKLGICTNKPQAVSDIVVSDLKLDRYFTAVIGAQVERARKPDPAMVHATLDALGVAPAEAVMIGDSAADVGAGQAAGLPVVVLSFGYSPLPAVELGGDMVADHWSDVPAAITALRG